MIINIENYQNLNQKIDDIVQAARTDYIDAVLTYCASNNLEIETVGELIAKNPLLLSKIELEAESLHYLKPRDRLPV